MQLACTKRFFFQLYIVRNITKKNQISGLVEYVTNFVYFFNYHLKMTPSFIQSLVLLKKTPNVLKIKVFDLPYLYSINTIFIQTQIQLRQVTKSVHHFHDIRFNTLHKRDLLGM